MKRRTGFSLIELLVVIGIITLLASLLLPSVFNSRKHASRAVGVANMRSLGQVHSVFNADHKGDYFNPFKIPLENTGVTPFRADLSDGRSWNFGFYQDNRFMGESFMAYWYSVMGLADPGSSLAPDAGTSPADGELLYQARNAASESLLFANSFYYSPVFWRKPEMYSHTTFPTNECPLYAGASPHGAIYRPNFCGDCECVLRATLARTNTAQVSYPDAKVLLFERADFFQKSRVEIRPVGTKTTPLPPAWNSPRSRPNVLTVDGAITQVNMSDLAFRAKESLTSDSSLALVPVDMLAVPDRLTKPLSSSDVSGLDAPPPGDGLYPMFFAATRYGIRGRDIAR